MSTHDPYWEPADVAVPPTPHVDVLDASPDAIVAVDADGRIAYVNPRTSQTFGYAADELIGRLVEMLVPLNVAEAHVRHRADFAAHPVPRPMGKGIELAARRKDGTEFPVEISLASVETANGRQVYATIVDITSRRSAESARAGSELRRFRAVLEASPNTIVGVDEDGRIRYANPRVEATFGYPPAKLIGRPIGTLLPEDLRELHETHRIDYMAAPVARSIGAGRDLHGRRKDGQLVPVEISLWPVDIDGSRQVYATIVDLSARKAAESQLLQAQKLESIGRLAGGIAHDFNNMLFAITGYAELLEQDLAVAGGALEPEAARRSVAAIQQAAGRAAELTSQLLAFSRQQVLVPRVMDVNAAIRAVEPMLQPLIGENVHLVMRLEADNGRIRADPGQFDQILVNLVVNARDAMPTGGIVSIQTSDVVYQQRYAVRNVGSEPGPYVLMSVSDTGVGMDRETRERLFEPFFTTKERGKGTGLGLATIYGIVHQAGGQIWVHSDIGKGSVFELWFPVVSEPVTEDVPAPIAAPSTRSGTILLVEDEPSVRDMTTQVLQRSGYRVIGVPDGIQALRAIAAGEWEPDVLVTDVVMPGMSGIELAERIRELHPQVGIVLLSGYTDETDDVTRLIGRGGVFVAKPATTGELLAAIDQTAVRHPEDPTIR